MIAVTPVEPVDPALNAESVSDEVSNSVAEEVLDGTVQAVGKTKRRTLAERIAESEKELDAAIYKLYVNTGLPLDAFKDKTDNLLERVRNGAYPNRRKVKLTTEEMIERLRTLYSENPDGLAEFFSMTPEERKKLFGM